MRRRVDQLAADFRLLAVFQSRVEIVDLLRMGGVPVGRAAAIVERVVRVGLRTEGATVIQRDDGFLRRDLHVAVFAVQRDFNLVVKAVVVHAPEGGLDAVPEGDQTIRAVFHIDQRPGGVADVVVGAVVLKAPAIFSDGGKNFWEKSLVNKMT